MAILTQRHFMMKEKISFRTDERKFLSKWASESTIADSNRIDRSRVIRASPAIQKIDNKGWTTTNILTGERADVKPQELVIPTNICT